MKRFKVRPPCGTLSGYDYHKRQELSEPCQECREAMKSHWKRKRVERKEQINKGRAQWRNDEQFYRSSNSKRLRKGAIQKPYTHKQVLDIFGANCHICKEPIDLQATRMTGRPGWERGLHIDHVIPLSKGGDDTLENVKPSHGRCNVEKSATLA